MALEFDLTCQFALNRYDLEIEKMRLSVWGVPDDTKPETKHPGKPKATPKAQTRTLSKEDIMRQYR